MSYFFHCHAAHTDLHSFPTRRSSDLLEYVGGLVLAGGGRTEVVAAVLVFRFLTFFLQIPLGGFTYLAWRRGLDRKSTRLNSSHQIISYAVFCLKKKKITKLYNDI